MSLGILLGCGDGVDEAEGDNAPSAGAGATPPPNASAGPTGPAPADGMHIDEPAFSFRAPHGWKMDGRDADSDLRYVWVKPVDSNDLSGVSAETWFDPGFDDVTRVPPNILENFRYEAKDGRKVADTAWAGQPAYHFVGTNKTLRMAVEQYGVIWHGEHIIVNIDHHTKTPRTERQALVDSIEASWEWK